MMINKLLTDQKLFLVIIILIGFLLRLYRIDNPVADWHSWRQADTAAVARNFFKEGFNPFLPKYDDMSGVAEKPYPNTLRLRFVEFPIYNSLVYFGYLLRGGVDEKIARLVSIFFSLGSIIFIYFVSRSIFGKFTALIAAFLFATLPFNIYFSRVILPEPILVFLCLGMFYFANRWIFENSKYLLALALVFTSFALLTKPFAIFYLLPLIYSYYQKEGKWWPVPKRYYLFLISFIPFVLWRIWINQYPQGIPASNWLFNGNGIRLRPAFWRWIIGDRLSREILSAPGLVLFCIGFLKRPLEKESLLLHLLLLSMFLYLIVVATGNVQHDYYQVLIVPALVIFLARGFVVLLKGSEELLVRFWTIPLGLLFLLLTLYLTWGEVKGLYQINNGVIVEAGKKADQVLPINAVVLAPYNGDTAFLYQTNRPGWPVEAYPIDELIRNYGVTHYVSVTYDAKTNWVMRKYTALMQTPRYVIVDLTKENPDFDWFSDAGEP